jgi:hypothetical protein
VVLAAAGGLALSRLQGGGEAQRPARPRGDARDPLAPPRDRAACPRPARGRAAVARRPGGRRSGVGLARGPAAGARRPADRDDPPARQGRGGFRRGGRGDPHPSRADERRRDREHRQRGGARIQPPQGRVPDDPVSRAPHAALGDPRRTRTLGAARSRSAPPTAWRSSSATCWPRPS